MKRPPPRLAPERALPPYTYVPGQAPHPLSDPAGHSYGLSRESPPPLDPARWDQSPTYLYGFDLFNLGYYWEAHETWEALWHAAGRRGAEATLLKGLIQLAVAGVKIRQGLTSAAEEHARRARDLFAELAPSPAGDQVPFAGFTPDELMALAERATAAAQTPVAAGAGPTRVFPFDFAPHAR
jgi:uncharacterized protein